MPFWSLDFRATWPPVAPYVLLVLMGWGALFVTPRPVHAQAAPSARTGTPTWEGAVFHTWQRVSEGRAPWQSVEALVQRRSARGAIILKAGRTRRFETWGAALTAEAWRDLWTRAYAHVRAGFTPDPRILPGQHLYAELYQATPGRWELAASYDHRRYSAQTVHTLGLGLGAYVGNWYLRAKTQLIPRAGHQPSAVQSLRARRYINPPREYVGVQVGAGSINAVVAEGPVLQRVTTYFVTAQFQRYITTHIGLSASASYSDDAFFVRHGLTVGVLARW